MFAADVAGIPIFVTGGIGGVHRGGETCKYWLKKYPQIVLESQQTFMSYLLYMD